MPILIVALVVGWTVSCIVATFIAIPNVKVEEPDDAKEKNDGASR